MPKYTVICVKKDVWKVRIFPTYKKAKIFAETMIKAGYKVELSDVQ